MILALLLSALLGVSPGETSPAAGAAPHKTRVAVLEVQVAGGGDRKEVEGLAALLASEVAKRRDVTVIAGADLRALLSFERQAQALGCGEGTCVTDLASPLGAAYIISSEVSKVGTTGLLSLTLLDASKAVAVSRLTRKFSTKDELVDEASRAVQDLLSGQEGIGPLAAPTRFDGPWSVTVECQPVSARAGAKGYKKRFHANIKDGLLSGADGEAGAPASLQLEGSIEADGKSRLLLHGITGGPEYNASHAPSGTAYSYHVNALFQGESGAGDRIEDRVCHFTFLKD